MAVEAKRRCGYRKVGGIYLVCEGSGYQCDKLPYNIEVCPVCSQGIKPSRGFTWIIPNQLFRTGECKATCPVRLQCPLISNQKQGLMWIGSGFYKEPEEFTREAAMMGISKRIAAVPIDFKVGETWVFLAHKKAGRKKETKDANIPDRPIDVGTVETVEVEKEAPAVFSIFKPTRIEKIVTETQSRDEAEMKKLRDRGITPVVVPDDDMDHRGTVYDKKKE